MVWWGYKMAGKSVLAGAKTGSRVGDGVAHAVSTHSAGRFARRGYLGPGDPPPPPTGPTDYYDYRGVATWRETANLDGGQFPLGSFIDLGGRRVARKGPIGLPGQLLTRHTVVVGPSGSGKTFSVLIPWIYAALASGWSVIAVDVKGDMREAFLDYKDLQRGAALGAGLTKWDFLDPTGSKPWEWLKELTTEARVDAAVTALLGRQPEKSSADPFFYQRDYRTLRGLLTFSRAVLPGVRTATDLMRTLEQDVQLDAAVRQNPRAPGAQDLDAALRYPAGEYPKVISGVVTALSALDTSGVNAVTRSTSARPSIDLRQVLDDHHLLIVGAQLQGGEISVTQSSLMLNQLAQRLYERFSGDRRPVLLVVDEAPQIADRVDLVKLMEVARSADVAVVAAMQDVAQVRDENERASMLANAASFMILPGSGVTSVRAFSERLGERFEQTVGVQFESGRRSVFGPPPSQSYGTEAVPVLREREIMEQPFGARTAAVHVKARELGITSKPFLVDMERASA